MSRCHVRPFSSNNYENSIHRILRVEGQEIRPPHHGKGVAPDTELGIIFGRVSEVVVVGVSGEDHGPVDGQFVVLAYDDEDAVVLVGAHIAGFDHLAGGDEGLESGGGLGSVGLVGFGGVDAPEA